MAIQLWHGDCLERLKGISDGVVSAITLRVTSPKVRAR